MAGDVVELASKRLVAAATTGRRNVAGAVLLGALVVGCAAHPPSPMLAGSSAPVSAASERRDWRLVHFPPPSPHVFFAENAPDGTTRVLIGGFRAELRGDTVTLAEEATFAVLLKSCRSDNGFLHLAEGGGLFWSGAFLGPLESVGVTRSDLYDRIVQCDPVVAISSTGRPTLALSRRGARLLNRPDLALVHFSTAANAHAIAPPDRLLETTDGGRTFAEVAARPSQGADEPAAWLGSRIEAPTGDDRPWEELHGLDANRVRAAWVRRAVASGAGRVVGGFALTGGTWARALLLDDGMKTFVAFRTRDGRVTDLSVQGRCRLLPWGEVLLAACPGEPAPLRALGPTGAVSLPSPPHEASAFVADPLGSWIAASSAAGSANGPPLFMTFDGKGWRKHPGLEVTPLAAGAGWLVVRRNQAASFALLRLADPEHGAVELAEKQLDENGVSLLERNLAFVQRTSVAPDPHPHATLTWRPLGTGQSTSVRALPAALYRLGFADEQHGIGVDSSGNVSVTKDAGQSFMGAPGEQWSADPRHELRCWSHGCAFADTVAFTDEALPAEPPARANPEVKLVEALLPSEHPNDDYFPALPAPEKSVIDTVLPAYRCRPVPALASHGAFEHLLGVENPDRPLIERAPALLGLLERVGNAFTWTGRDKVGDFRVQAPPLSGDAASLAQGWLAPLGLALKRPALSPVLLTRAYAVLVQDTDAVTNCFVVHVDGRIEQLMSAPHAHVRTVALPNGGGAVLVSAPGWQEVIELNRDGQTQARRWFVGPAGRLAFGPDGVVFVIPEGEHTRVYSLTPGSAGREMTWNTHGAFPDCRDTAAPPRAASYLVSLDPPSIELGSDDELNLAYPDLFPNEATAVSWLEISPRGGCWRGALLSEAFPLELHATRAGIRGTLIGPHRTHALVCRRADQ